VEEAKIVFTKKYKKWMIADYKVAITYKPGPSPPKDEVVALLRGKSAQFQKIQRDHETKDEDKMDIGGRSVASKVQLERQ
jgi:hypothetical protein